MRSILNHFLKLITLSLTFLVAAGASHANFGNDWKLEFQEQAQELPLSFSLQEIAKMTNDRDGTVNTFSLAIDAKGKVEGFHNASPGFAATYPLSIIESKEGAVLAEAEGRKVVFLLGKLNRPSQEGRFQLKYLANGLSMKYSTCDFLLKKSGSNWYIQNAYTGARVNRIHITTWSLGVKTILGICPQ